MNAGAYGGELKDVIESVEFIDSDGEIKTLSAAELDFGYRRSAFQNEERLILSAELVLRPGDGGDIKALMDDFGNRRRHKQPLDLPSAGSVFKRPEGHFAGALIEGAGLKGLRVGGAQVSEKHAGFIVNTGGATAADVLALVETIRARVREKYGVELELEIRVV